MRGFGLIEVVIGAAIITVFLSAAISAFVATNRLTVELVKKTTAQYLAEEGLEAARLIRDSGWQANIVPLTPATPYYFEFAGGRWRLTPAVSLVDGIFDRSVKIAAGYRDGNGDIAPTGATDDDLRLVTVTVTWPGSTGGTTSLTTYLTNLFDN